MGDLFGISRTIDHAVYTILNSIAIILWRLDAAIIQFSMFSYVTEDWLMGHRDGEGIWALMDKMVGPNGIFGLSTWEAFVALALTIYGFSLLIRPFWRMQPVDLGRMFFFAVLSYSIITEGSELMREIENWRGEAGGYMYDVVAGSGGTVNLDVPGGATSDEPIYSPEDLDGRAPIRGWEAVSTSYFLVKSASELHQGVPPEDFRREYCLYDPSEEIGEQDQENSDGCSPKKAWDEWEEIQLTAPITQVWGIPLPIDVSIEVPVFQEHPENRQLAIRQAQEGVARLALGPIVAALPMIEANVGLMLALSAAFVYLSLPLTLLFGLFRYTEPLVNRLVMQLIGIIIRTFILNGVLAIFLMLLVSVSVNGSLMAYLGLIGVGLVGGFFLTKMATSTMTETVSTSLGGLTSIWVGAATTTLGEGARQPAMAAAGAVKWGAAGAMLGWAGRGAFDMWEGARQVARSGSEDLRQGSPETMQAVDSQLNKTVGALPAPIARMAQPEVNEWTAQPAGGRTSKGYTAPNPSSAGNAWVTDLGGMAASAVGGTLFGSSFRDNTDRNNQAQPGGWNEQQTGTPGITMGDGRSVETWANQVYQTRQTSQGERQVIESGQAILGESLGQQAYQAMSRHNREETLAVLQAARAAASEAGSVERLVQADGALTDEGFQMVRGHLESSVLAGFKGQQGERDLEALVVASLQPQKRAEPGEFRVAAARAKKWEGDEASGRLIPRSLGLDPVASGSNFAALNRFTRLSNQAGLDEAQRKRLLEAVRQEGEVSSALRREIETSLRRQQERGLGATLKADDLIDSARALPDTLEGPMLVRLSRSKPDSETGSDTGAVGLSQGAGKEQTHFPGNLAGPEVEAGPSDLKKSLSSHRTGRVGPDGDKGSQVKKPPKTTANRSDGIRHKLTEDRPAEIRGGVDGVSGSVKGVPSSLIEAEEIKTRASTAKQKQALEREALPSLKLLDEEESLISMSITTQKKTQLPIDRTSTHSREGDQ